MNNLKSFIFPLIICLLFSQCKRIDDAADAKKVGACQISVNASSKVDGLALKGLKIVLENFAEGFRKEMQLDGVSTQVSGLIPGIYSINISGRVENANGETYYVNGSKINYPVLKDGEAVDISIAGTKISPLIFSEIFYAGTSPFYFRNQFYEIYNNSDETIYLDGLYFGNVTPGNATTVKPLWPSEDGEKYVYVERLWKVPGNGTDYPLKAGESFVISQFAANHKLPLYNPASPIDGSSSEFEFNMDNPNFPNQPAVDMVHAYYNGSASKGSLPQFLTPVFGGAFVIFKVPAGTAYDPANDPNMRTRNMVSSSTTLYAKVPREYVLDAVECGDNANSINGKRVPSVLDAGMTYVGATYNSQGVARKKAAENEDGTPVLTDTNNSTEDFERGVVPMFRRHGSKMPSWNHTLRK